MMGGPLPQEEYEHIYSRVPRLTVEVVIWSRDGVLLTLRHAGPCQGLWHIPGGTVRYGEPLTDAVRRVADEELGLSVEVEGLLGYIEYPSHLRQGIDWPVGITFKAGVLGSPARALASHEGSARWFSVLPEAMHDEQKDFLRAHGLAT